MDIETLLAADCVVQLMVESYKSSLIAAFDNELNLFVEIPVHHPNSFFSLISFGL